MIAAQWEIPRPEQDELALRSHRLAAQATDEGRFEREIVPVDSDGERRIIDQEIRRDTNLEALSALKPAFKEGGTVTAGNSSQISDGAAAVLLMSREKAGELGFTPRARIFDATTVGVDPVIMLTGPIPATRTLLKRNRMTIDDLDLIEINEAFASVVCGWRRELKPEMDRVNVNGGALARRAPAGLFWRATDYDAAARTRAFRRRARARHDVHRRRKRHGHDDPAGLAGCVDATLDGRHCLAAATRGTYGERPTAEGTILSYQAYEVRRSVTSPVYRAAALVGDAMSRLVQPADASLSIRSLSAWSQTVSALQVTHARPAFGSTRSRSLGRL